MSQSKKLLAKFLELPQRSDLTFQDLQTIMSAFGYALQERAGSRVAFIKNGEQPISLHKPHPGNIIKRYMVKQLQEQILQLQAQQEMAEKK